MQSSTHRRAYSSRVQSRSPRANTLQQTELVQVTLSTRNVSLCLHHIIPHFLPRICPLHTFFIHFLLLFVFSCSSLHSISPLDYNTIAQSFTFRDKPNLLQRALQEYLMSNKASQLRIFDMRGLMYHHL